MTSLYRICIACLGCALFVGSVVGESNITQGSDAVSNIIQGSNVVSNITQGSDAVSNITRGSDVVSNITQGSDVVSDSAQSDGAVNGISPGNSPARGGAVLTLNGVGFVEAGSIFIGDSACMLTSWHSATSLACIAPAGVLSHP
jgi:hypothetical protein